MKSVLTTILVALYISSPTMAADSAVILMYHRFGEKGYPSTNTTIEQLESHIRELKSGPYTVLPVLEIMAHIKNDKFLPERTIGITVDDGFNSAYTEGWPRFKRAQIPFTVFVSTNSINQGRPNRLNWQQIREMHMEGVAFGAHSASHLHMANSSRKRNELEIIKSNNQFKMELGEQPTIFAYPFGEASSEVFKIIAREGYDFGFGQHSGVVHRSSNFKYLPRFALNEKYGEINRFRLAVNSLPLPVANFTPANPKLGIVNPPYVGFTVIADLKNLSKISCFTSSEGRVPTTLLGTSRVEVRMTRPFAIGRTRLNCTLPSDNGRRWHWLGSLFVVTKS